MTTPRRDVDVAPGFTFCPRPKDLTDLYLRRKIAGEPLPDAAGRFIHEVDVYSAEPEQLARAFEKAPGTGNGDKLPVWYFFSPVRHPGGRKKNARGGAARKSRTINRVVGKHWHSESQAKPVVGGSVVGGYRQHFSYKVKNEESGKDVRAGWIMYEYGISEEHKGGDLVLCEIHPSPNKRKQAAAAVPVSDPTISSRKRKAAADHPEGTTTTASTRPRRTVDQDDQHPTMAESLGAAAMMTTEDADDYHRHTSADETLLDATEVDNLGHHMAFEEGVGNYSYGGDPADTAAAQVQEMDDNFFDNVNVDGGLYQNNVVMVQPGGDRAAPPAAQPEVREMDGNFFDNVDGLYQNNVVMAGPGGDLAMAPAAQPGVQEMEGSAPPPLPSNFFHNVEQEFPSLYQVVALEEEASGLAQSITADGTDEHHGMEEGTQQEPEEQAADEPIYGLPCPDFSPEMIRMCSRMPWPLSPTSMAAILSGL